MSHKFKDIREQCLVILLLFSHSATQKLGKRERPILISLSLDIDRFRFNWPGHAEDIFVVMSEEAASLFCDIVPSLNARREEKDDTNSSNELYFHHEPLYFDRVIHFFIQLVRMDFLFIFQIVENGFHNFFDVFPLLVN